MRYNKADSKKFSKINSQVPENLAVFLSEYSADEYDNMGATCYLSEDEKSGYAIKPDGDLISVFSLPGAKQGSAAIKSAIKTELKNLIVLVFTFKGFTINSVLLNTTALHGTTNTPLRIGITADLTNQTLFL
jgi:hypothetical protein